MPSPRFAAISAAILCLPSALMSAEDHTLQNAAYQAGVEQQALRSQTQRLVADISAMLEEFRKNPTATEEVALTETTLKKLQSLSDKDMADVVTAMKEASDPKKSGNTALKILAANKTAKEIQISLTSLADKLALYQDEASIELRLTALLRRQLTNQRQAKYLVQGIVQGEDQKKEAELTSIEQKAIAQESNNLLYSLKLLAANPASSSKAAFLAAYNAGITSQLLATSQLAYSRASAGDFPNTYATQGKVIESLQMMLLVLDNDKTLEERYRAAEQSMRSLAGREQTLARNTIHAPMPQGRAIMLRQQEIADQRTIVERSIMQLSPATAPLLGQSRQTMEAIDDTFQKQPGLLDQPDPKLQVVNTQNSVAKNFLDIAEMLKKQADAAASSSGQGGSNQAQDALANAATSVMNAINNMDMVDNLLNRGGDSNAAKDQMGQAQGNLSNAMKHLGDAGNAAPEGVGEDLKNSSKSLGKGQETASQGGPNTSANVGDARNLASKALADMQKALSAMSGKSQMAKGGQVQNPTGQQTEGSGSGSGWGALFKHTNDSSAYNAVAQISPKDRAALSMLQREIPPPEYSTLSEQYLKNLADGVVPAQ